MTDVDTSAEAVEWPREIWMAERDDHDQGIVSAVLSEHATVARWAGDSERDKEYHHYIDMDVYDSAEKYHAARYDALAAERDALRAAIKRQAGAAKTLRQLTLDEVQHLKDADRTNHIAPSVIQGEREANAILSADNEALRAQLAEEEAQVQTARNDALREAAAIVGRYDEESTCMSCCDVTAINEEITALIQPAATPPRTADQR